MPQASEHVLIAIGKLFGLRVDVRPVPAVSGNCGRVEVVQPRIGQHAGIGAVAGLAFAAQHPEVFVDAVLVCAADAPESPRGRPVAFR